MAVVSDERALWLARHILPAEPALRAFILRMRLPVDLDVDDVVQDIYGKLAAMPSVDAIHNPRNYAFSVARTIVLMHVRRSKVVSIRAIDDRDALTMTADEPSPEQIASDREQLHLLGLAVAALPDPIRHAFLMRVIEELPHKEIARRLEMTENAVQKSIAKCIVALIKKLGRGGNGGAEASRGMQQLKEDRPDETARDERGH